MTVVAGIGLLVVIIAIAISIYLCCCKSKQRATSVVPEPTNVGPKLKKDDGNGRSTNAMMTTSVLHALGRLRKNSLLDFPAPPLLPNQLLPDCTSIVN